MRRRKCCMKKWFSLILAISMICGLSACGQDTGGVTVGDGTSKLTASAGGLQLPLTEKGEIITWVEGSSIENLNELFVAQTLREVTGINLQLMVFPGATVNDKVKTMIASRELPDVIGAGFKDNEEINDLAIQGAFVSVDDKLSIMPNFKKLFYDDEETNWIFNSYQASDGHLYVVPNYGINREVNHGMMYRKDVFDKHNIKPWTNSEEFYENLKALRSLYPESNPFTVKTGIGLIQDLATGWGITYNGPYYDEAQKVWKYSDVDPQMKNLLDYVRKLYDEKLLDPEFLTLTQASWTSKMTQADKAFVTFDWIGRLDSFPLQAEKTVPGYDLRYGYPIGPKGTLQTLPKVTGGLAVSNNPNHELALQLVDFLLSDAGAEVVSMGLEGVTYTLGEDGKADYIEFPDINPTISELEAKYGMFSSTISKRFDRRCCYYQFSEREQQAQDFAKIENIMEPADPILRFTEAQKEIITEKLPNLKKAADEFFSNYIISDKTGDAAWNAWLQKAEQLGYKEILQVYNDAQKEYDK